MTDKPMRYIELFAGAGGMSRGLEAAGLVCVAHAEIEPHAQAVLRQHWPDTPLHGDVTQVDWTTYAGQVEVVAGGSPCQDLSVAGKRAGLAGARSGLFYELLRAWDETGATYCLWENVDGARSSNHGGDFAAVLSAFVGTALPVPSDGWRSSGVAAGPTGVAAWRVLDLQHFGPPQRRRRLFVVAARAGGADPAEVLALSESVCGHPSPRQQQRERAAAGTGGGIESVSTGCGKAASSFGGWEEGIGCLRAKNALSSIAVTETMAFHQTQDPISGEVSPALGATSAGMGVVSTIPANYGRGVGHNRDDLFVLSGEQANSGIGINLAPTMGTSPAGRLWAVASDGRHPTLNTTHFGKHFGCNQHVHELGTILPAIGRPRRLTPLECERLMSWPDQWTAIGRREDGSPYALSDTARYRLCGNGVGSVCATWIATRLNALHA